MKTGEKKNRAGGERVAPVANGPAGSNDAGVPDGAGLNDAGLASSAPASSDPMPDPPQEIPEDADLSPDVAGRTCAPRDYIARAVWLEDQLRDIIVDLGGRSLSMFGSAGLRRELSALPQWQAYSAGDDGNRHFNPARHLPVFIGAGAGAALSEFIGQWLRFQAEQAEGGERAALSELRLAVVDKEGELRRLAKLPENELLRLAPITWISAEQPEKALRELTEWQLKHNGLALYPIALPFYLRLDRDYYGFVNEAAKASLKADFWGKVQYPKFKDNNPRVMLLTSKYFLIGEILAACERLGVEHRLVQFSDSESDKEDFVQRLLTEVLEFKPDFVFTINHLGVDREGVLIDLLKRLSLPLCSWFVDNPHLVLNAFGRVVSPETIILTWDTDNVASLREMGFKEVHYLPLGVDVERFALPAAAVPVRHPWRSRVSFVGNSMVYKVVTAMRRSGMKGELTRDYREVAADFAAHDERSVGKFIKERHPDKYSAIMSRDNSAEDLLNYEVFLTWEATRQYRSGCVESILPFNPLIVGDKGWKLLFGKSGHPWRYHAELNYYSDLPNFYPLSDINFNCTSKQMKGAVNQRVFDVPATGAFIITDWREQMEQLFVPEKEIVCYNSPAEAGELVRYYLDKPAERAGIALAARKRILAEHTYDHRLRRLLRLMKNIVG